MQRLAGISSSKTIRARVENERELLVFLKAKAIHDGFFVEHSNYLDLVPSLTLDMRQFFDEHLRVVVYDFETGVPADEFSDRIILLVTDDEKFSNN